MNYTDWKKGFGECCADIVQKYDELYSHIDKIADLPEMADQEMRDEASALIVVKLSRMHQDVAAAASRKPTTATEGESLVHGGNAVIHQGSSG